jgi:hypothetical protein
MSNMTYEISIDDNGRLIKASVSIPAEMYEGETTNKEMQDALRKVLQSFMPEEETNARNPGEEADG